MADTPAPAKAGGKGFWTHKLGPFPVYVWGIGVVAVGGYYWYTHYGPGASKGQAQGQQQGKQAPAKITQTIYYYGRRGRGRGRHPRPGGAAVPAGSAGAGPAGDAAVAAAAGVPAQYGAGPGAGGTMAGVPAPPPTPWPNRPGGPGRPPNPGGRDKRDRDKRDRDRRRVAAGPQEQAAVIHDQPTGQPVSPDNGQPVYWEWTHAHRGPEISAPVPAPQTAYAPGTSGATYAAASTAAEAAVA